VQFEQTGGGLAPILLGLASTNAPRAQPGSQVLVASCSHGVLDSLEVGLMQALSGSSPLKITQAYRWAVRAVCSLLWATPLCVAALTTFTTDARAQAFNPAAEQANLERARVRRLGNIVGVSLIAAVIVIPLSVALIRDRRSH